MSNYFEDYKRILGLEITGDKEVNAQNAINDRTIRFQQRAFMDSPTLKYVTYDYHYEEVDGVAVEPVADTPVIQSDRYKNIELQKFLFAPKTEVEIGKLIHDGKNVYLIIEHNGDDIFPGVVARLCNDVFEIPTGGTEWVENGLDGFGNPIYIEVPSKVDKVPVIASNKDYSTSDNAIIPLPSGRINIDMPFKESYLEHFEINYRFEYDRGDYRVTDINVVQITPNEKYIRVSATRVVAQHNDNE